MTAGPDRRPLWLALALAAVLMAVLYRHFDLGRLLSLDTLKASRDSLVVLYQQRPLATLLGFFTIYVAAAALSIPGATVLTLAGGAMFGLGLGLVVVSFASSLGALLAFLAARYLLRDTVQARFAKQLAPINEGMQRDGVFYLLSLRLVPVFPFFVINLLAGLTPIGAGRFYWVSQLGMLAGTAVYVNAGTQLASVQRSADVLSPALLWSFVLLGVFPLIAKWFVGMLKARQVYAKWPKPRRFDRNLVVIGAGAGGLVTAYIAAAVKASVTLVEADKMGGDCLNHGCVPSKALIRSARLAKELRQAEALGLRGAGTARVDFAAVMARVQQVIRDIEPHDSVQRYTALGVDVVLGHARITSPWSVEITTAQGVQTLTTRSIVIATGSRPIVPPLPGLAEVGCLTSDTLWGLTELPRRLLVLGGGPIGCELAQSFARLGSQVTVVEMAPRVLLREDADVAALVADALRADGVRLLTGHQALRCEKVGDDKRLIVKAVDAPGSPGSELTLEFDALLCAVGRSPRTSGFGLEALGMALTPRKTIETDAYLQTLYPNIYAVGDVAGPYQFTHTASHQAWYAAVNALFGHFKRFKADYSVIPWATFTDPEVARVGLSPAEATEQGITFELTRYALAELDRAIVDDATKGFVQVLTVPGKDRILGVTIVGEHAGDLLAEYVLAMKHGLGLNKILGTIHTYPTLAEANKYVAGEWKRAHAPRRLLAWAERLHAWRRGA
jgi:pyruvate/2-oxoglutarate dehydrogenase complex dihydrolipoamide dehydrogenase (E3) component/uncharacterized membrane protein YdjX (TVP38/TMEM64 family)